MRTSALLSRCRRGTADLAEGIGRQIRVVGRRCLARRQGVLRLRGALDADRRLAEHLEFEASLQLEDGRGHVYNAARSFNSRVDGQVRAEGAQRVDLVVHGG